MANMTFKTNILPSTSLGYSLGNTNQKWNVYGNLKGNADSATALTSNAGSSTVPIYFSGGKPVQCSTTLGVSITGNAATATKLSNTPNNTTTFLRGDNTWTNQLTGAIYAGESCAGILNRGPGGTLRLHNSSNTNDCYTICHTGDNSGMMIYYSENGGGSGLKHWFLRKDGQLTAENGGIDTGNGIWMKAGSRAIYSLSNNTWYPILTDADGGWTQVNSSGYDLILGSQNTPNIEFYAGGSYLCHMRAANTRFIAGGAGGDVSHCAIMIRENLQKGASADRNWHWSPRIGFFWEGVTNGQICLEPNGDISFRRSNSDYYLPIRASAFLTNSSYKLKENIKDYNESAIDLINNIKICSFNFKETQDFKVGFIAENTNSIFSTVNQDSMDTANCIGMLLKAVQELSAKINELENYINTNINKGVI